MFVTTVTTDRHRWPRWHGQQFPFPVTAVTPDGPRLVFASRYRRNSTGIGSHRVALLQTTSQCSRATDDSSQHVVSVRRGRLATGKSVRRPRRSSWDRTNGIGSPLQRNGCPPRPAAQVGPSVPPKPQTLAASVSRGPRRASWPAAAIFQPTRLDQQPFATTVSRPSGRTIAAIVRTCSRHELAPDVDRMSVERMEIGRDWQHYAPSHAKESV
jgi:hypothetical protein